MNALKPCPFCGGEATLVEYWLKGVANKKNYFVQCKPCGIRKDNHHSGYNSASKAIRAWNKRANGRKMDEVEAKQANPCDTCWIAQNYNLEDDDTPCQNCGEDEDASETL